MQYFYINGRYVRNRTMMAGMEMAYKGTMMQGKFPGGILLLEMPADLVDVNVHPAKIEVRFARENDIFDLVYHAVKLSLSQPGTGERLFTFDEPKSNEKSKNEELNDMIEENTVKKNSFTGLSAILRARQRRNAPASHCTACKTGGSFYPGNADCFCRANGSFSKNRSRTFGQRNGQRRTGTQLDNGCIGYAAPTGREPAQPRA